MNILSIDTSTDKVSVSLKINDDVDSLENKQEIRASQIILSMIDKILRKHNINCKDLTAITFNLSLLYIKYTNNLINRNKKPADRSRRALNYLTFY